MEERLDNILKLLDVIKKDNTEGQRDLRWKLKRLKREFALGQEDTTQRVVKRLNEDRTLVFKKKGNERQFLFNDNVKDQIDATRKHFDLLEPALEVQRETLQKAREELDKGLSLLAGRQKRIKLADHSKYRWAVVDEYEDNELASDEDDTKRIEKAEKTVAAKVLKQKKAPNLCTSRQVRGRQPEA